MMTSKKITQNSKKNSWKIAKKIVSLQAPQESKNRHLPEEDYSRFDRLIDSGVDPSAYNF